MIRTAIILVMIYALYRLYMRMFQEKSCSSCGKHIPKHDPVCHHCSVVQSTASVIEVNSVDQDIKAPAASANLLRSPLVLSLLLISQLAVAAAIYFLVFR
jgi:hypothetical protein